MSNRSWTVFICAGLLLCFAAIAWLAVGTKSPAYDEPYHAVSSWLQFHYFDFRLDDEDPPLWQYWASLLNPKDSLKADFTSEIWRTMPRSLEHQWYWGVQTLYRTPGNDPDKLIAHCRMMMLLVAVGLGVLICVWAWQLCGGAAAVVAVFLFCLDPNFLAHSPLMKNDVAFAMSMFALAFVLWKAGQRLTIGRVVWIGLLCVVTLTVKFSGIVAVLLVPLLPGIRAVMPGPWLVFGRVISKRQNRLLIAGGITLFAIVASYAGIWAVYGFRFSPTPERGVYLNLDQITKEIRINAMIARYHGSPPAGVKEDAALPLPARAAVFAEKHRLLPQAFVGGFLFTYANGLVRFAYANGEISAVGWWWYFPFAILVKTPVATLLAVGWAGVIGVRRLLVAATPASPSVQDRPRCDAGVAATGRRWAIFCLVLPVALFLASAMSSNLNIGIRHILSIYPFLFVATGVVAARRWKTRGRNARVAIGFLGLLLVIETFSAYPNFIAYFNSVANNLGGGKLALLGDSNLDWGQDLPLLAQWQKANPEKPLYLCYFGYADPRHYGIRYIPMPGGYHYDTPPHFPSDQPFTRSVVAISASNLQGPPLLFDPKLSELVPYYRKWAARKPIAVLGDSIYLYEYDPAESFRR